MKIYARQIAPEYQESPLLLDKEFWSEGIILDGNRHYNSHTIPAYDQIVRYFDEMAGEWENDGCYYTYEDGKPIMHKRKRECTIAEYLREYGFRREDGKIWTTKQRHEWRLLIEGDQAADSDEVILAALRLITGHKWDTTTIRGCCQGDWQNVYFDAEKWSHEELDYFETEYFNTGSEWIIHNGERKPKNPGDIEGYSIYCHGWNEDQIKQEIAEAEGGKAKEVVLFVFKGYANIPIYEAV